MQNEFLNNQIREQTTHQIVADSIRHRRMAELHSQRPIASSRSSGYGHSPYITERKIYKSQVVALVVSVICAIIGIVTILAIFT